MNILNGFIHGVTLALFTERQLTVCGVVAEWVMEKTELKGKCWIFLRIMEFPFDSHLAIQCSRLNI